MAQPDHLPLNGRPLKRNDIVYERKAQGYYSPMGRVNRRISDSLVEVIDSTKHIIVETDDYWILDNSYKGYEFYGRFSRMQTLRQLKQRAAVYNPRVWAKNRKNKNDLIELPD